MRKTLILGATNNPSRYAYLAANKLVRHGHEIINVGIKSGEVAGKAIQKPDTIHSDVHTVTLYVGPANQPPLFDYIIKTNPQRIVFNPGTENDELEILAKTHGIEVVHGCTLVMLSTGEY